MPANSIDEALELIHPMLNKLVLIATFLEKNEIIKMKFPLPGKGTGSDLNGVRLRRKVDFYFKKELKLKLFYRQNI